MANFRRRRTFRGSSPRRKRQWARDLTASVLTADQVSRHDMLTDYRADSGLTALGGHTAVRFIIEVNASWVTAPDPISDFISYGIKVESTHQTAPFTGTAPINASHSDWLWWDICPPGRNAGSLQQAYCHFDLRSKRKVEELDESLFMYILSPSVDASTRVTTSMLLLLP